MIKAIFLDVDGTLISFKTHDVPRSAIDALLRAHKQGVQLFIATGRAADDLEVLHEIPYDGVVALNGSRCVAADGSVVSEHLIPRKEFLHSLELSESIGFPLALELENGVFINQITPDVERLAHMVAHPVPRKVDVRALYDVSECCQMCFYFDEATEQRVMKELPTLVASRWCPIFADINVAGIDKATGMREFMRQYGFSTAEVAAIGDGGNDLSMLRAAGVGIAMGNAVEDVKLAADFVTSSVDDEGIARALEYLGI